MVLAEVVVHEDDPKAKAKYHDYDGEFLIAWGHWGKLKVGRQVPKFISLKDQPNDIEDGAKTEHQEVEFDEFFADNLEGKLTKDPGINDKLNRKRVTLRNWQIKKESIQVRNSREDVI